MGALSRIRKRYSRGSTDSAPPRPEDRYPDPVETRPGSLLGYRSWAHHPSSECLLSTGDGQTAWRPGVNVAYCIYTPHRPPDADCTCGFYALHEPDPKRYWGGEIIGALAARGDVRLHKHGWRAEEVQIIGLCAEGLNRSERRRAEQMSGIYNVPLLETIAELRAHAERLAQPAPSELIAAIPEPAGEDPHQSDPARLLTQLAAPAGGIWIMTLLWLVSYGSYSVTTSTAKIWLAVNVVAAAALFCSAVDAALASRAKAPPQPKLLRWVLGGISPLSAALVVLISALCAILVISSVRNLSDQTRSPLNAVSWKREAPSELPRESRPPQRHAEVSWAAESEVGEIGEIQEFQLGRWSASTGVRAEGLFHAELSPVASLRQRSGSSSGSSHGLPAEASWRSPPAAARAAADPPRELPLISSVWAKDMAGLAGSSETGGSGGSLSVISQPALQMIDGRLTWLSLVGPEPTPEGAWLTPRAQTPGASPYQAVLTSAADGSTRYIRLNWSQIKTRSLQRALTVPAQRQLVLRGGRASLQPLDPRPGVGS